MYDTLISGGHLLTMAGEGVGFVERGAIAIDQGVIVAIGPRDEVEAKQGIRMRRSLSYDCALAENAASTE